MNELDTRTIKRLAAIKVVLSRKALTVVELAEALHLNRASAGKYMKDLRGNRVFVERWVRGDDHITAAYRWGSRPDAPKPIRATCTEYERARMGRIRANPDEHDKYLSYHRARNAAKRAAKTPNPWFAALPGARAILGAQP